MRDLKSESEQLPVPCRRCGAPMREQSSGDPWQVTMACHFCQCIEQLPADLTERVRVLRERLSRLAAAQTALQGPTRLVAQLSDSRHLLPLFALAMGLTLFSLVPTLRRVLPALANPSIARADKLLVLDANLSALSHMLGILGGLAVAWLIARAHYLRALRPHLLARPPAQLGLATRCRCCGGGLPEARTAFVTCRYCNTQNLVSDDVARRRTELLEQEIRDYLARARGATLAVQRAMVRSNGIYYGCWALGMLLGIALGRLGSALLVRMLLPA